MTVIEIAKIRLDGGTQIRVAVDDNTVEEYAESLKNGAKFPPVDVYFDGAEYWLADGFHRLSAHVKNGLDTIEVKVTEGTQREAILHAAGANSTHGLRRSNADKRRAVETLLRDEKWRKQSDRWIAKTCAVSDKTIAKIRTELSCGIPQLTERIGQDGKTRKAARARETVFAPAARERQLSTLKQGESSPVPDSADLRERDGKASEQAAAALNVSPRTVENAARVLSHGTPELVAAVDRGEVAVSAAAESGEKTYRTTEDRLVSLFRAVEALKTHVSKTSISESAEFIDAFANSLCSDFERRYANSGEHIDLVNALRAVVSNAYDFSEFLGFNTIYPIPYGTGADMWPDGMPEPRKGVHPETGKPCLVLDYFDLDNQLHREVLPAVPRRRRGGAA